MELIHSIQLSKLEGPYSAPENLRSATKSFTLGLAVERDSKSLDDFTQSVAWGELQKRLDGYTDQLTLYHAQGTQRLCIIVALYLLCACILSRTSSKSGV